ncbi:hypothetical protein [Denitrobaculum tricleocarpae]|uniref:hypothetical protein n=1 Tax=Denitrobaculum tricleocarpae TaxID=2591009 RepID=UPI0015D441C9|nr:hypothetical protein [Denitrobaculum tricleocarpae]
MSEFDAQSGALNPLEATNPRRFWDHAGTGEGLLGAQGMSLINGGRAAQARRVR